MSAPRGHVEPGGPALVERVGPGLTLAKLSVGPMDNNAYLLTPDEGASVVIDAAAEPERLLQLIDDRPVATIVTTHQHHDHIGALTALAEATGARLLAGTPDVDAIEEQTGVRPDPVWSGDTIAVGEATLQVIGIVGHTPGSITLAYEPHDGSPTQLFTGDSLFPGGPGKTWSEEDFQSLITELETKIFAVYPDPTVFHPGHGDDSTIGTERPQLAEWRALGW